MFVENASFIFNAFKGFIWIYYADPDHVICSLIN